MEKQFRSCRYTCPTECNVTQYQIDSAQTTLGNVIVLQKLLNLTDYNFTKSSAKEYLRYKIILIQLFTKFFFAHFFVTAV